MMVREVLARTVLNRHRRRDSWFLDDYSLNPYYLCDFNCVYCYIHGGRYGGGADRLAVKVNAPTILARELRRRAGRGEYGFIALSSATEPWMRIEGRYRVTRRCLEVIARYRFPVHCLTKSTLVLRDVDLLEDIDRRAVLPEDLRARVGRGVMVTVSLSTLDEGVARLLEPNAPRPCERLDLVKELVEEGFHAGIAFIPVLPFISDSEGELERMVRAAREVGARYVYFGLLTLEGRERELYLGFLGRAFPELVGRYESLYRRRYPEKAYSDRFFKTVIRLCRRYGVRLGGTPDRGA